MVAVMSAAARKETDMTSQFTGSSFSRRGFLGIAGGVAATAGLAACSTNGGGSSGSAETIKFWNMPWGGTKFNPLDKKITLDYKPAAGLGAASYQVIQWANFTQTFTSAVASNTGPAVSSGGGTQAFQYAHEGKIAYADSLLEAWKSNGLYDDFLDGLIDTMKTDEGYAAIPYNLDVRVNWYNKELMDEAGATPPKTWDEYYDACAALKKIGVFGFGQGSGPGNFVGGHIIVAFMNNNGGGVFNADKQPDLLTTENIEAVEFCLDLVKSGFADPAAATYTSQNVQAQWKAKKFGMGWAGAGLPAGAVGDVAKDLVVGDPLTSPSGKQGGLYFPNNIMMYKESPSQQASEEFLTYYFKNMAPLWTENTGISLPPLKSITETPEFRANSNNVKIVDEWQPVGRTWAAPGGDGLFADVSIVDGTPAMITFSQSILTGVDATAALTDLQAALMSNVKQ